MAVSDEASGVNCTVGGKKIDAGLDNGDGGGIAGDGILQSGEIDSTEYVCNGVSATSSLIAVTDEAAGSNCTVGGKKIDIGLDNGDGGGIAGDGIFQSGEIDSTEYVCNGTDGSDGSSATNSLISVTVEAAGLNCTAGGQQIDAGLDNGDGGGTAGDGILQSGEIDSTEYVCNGADGSSATNSLIVVTDETLGENCTAGGKKVDVGLDNGDGGGTAGDGILQFGEIDSTEYVCNGITTLQVSAISPNDGSTGVSISASISLTFTKAVDTTTMTTNTADTSCSGSIQVSADNFSTCVQMSGSPSSSDSDRTFTLTPASNLASTTTYKIKITTDVKDTSNNTLTSQFSTTAGFTTAASVTAGLWDSGTWDSSIWGN